MAITQKGAGPLYVVSVYRELMYRFGRHRSGGAEDVPNNERRQEVTAGRVRACGAVKPSQKLSRKGWG